MEEVSSNQSQIPPQISEKPASIMVFGVLNCVFVGLGIVPAIIVLLTGSGMER